MRALANAAFEGLLVCDDKVIATVNASLATLVGKSERQLVGSHLAEILPNADARHQLEEKPDAAFETVLRSASGGEIEVEVICRPISFAGRPHKAIAIRDLRVRRKPSAKFISRPP